jgi:ribosomal protein L11 methyltransferase
MRTWPALDVGPLPDPDLFQAALLDYGVSAIDETNEPDAWRVFFNTEADRNMAAQALSRQFPDTVIRSLDVPDEDWVARSQASLTAVRIGDIVVAPPWDVPDVDVPGANVGANVARRLKPARYEPAPYVIVIRPSMGFGTGHHATTRLCLAALQDLDLRGRRVIDVGTGSGLLAIAASRLGAADVVGIDEDADAFHAAQENAALNPAAAVTLRHVDVRRVSLEPFDVVVANLTGALLREAAPRLHDLTTAGGYLVASGFMAAEERDVMSAYSKLTIAARAEEDEWLCVTFRRQ